MTTVVRFNMMTLVMLTWIGFFTLPLVYKNNQVMNNPMTDIDFNPLKQQVVLV